MSVKLTTQDLTGVAVGKTGSFDWSSYVTVRSEAMPLQPSAHLKVFNDTGCALEVRFSQSGKSVYISPGAWPTFVLAPDDTGMTWTVESIIAGGNYARLAAIYYAPGEELDDTGALGNSPIGGSIQVGGAGDIDQVLTTPGILSGFATSTPFVNMLTVQSGVALFRQANNNVEPVTFLLASFTTSTPSTTYFVDLNPDSTYSFATTHSTQVGYIPAYTVTTDGSGNISTVSPVAASFIIQVFSSAANTLQFAPLANLVQFYNTQFQFTANFENNVGIVGAIQELGGVSTAGNFGVPPIIVQVYEQHVTGTGAVTLVSFTAPANSLYRVSGYVRINNGTSGNNVKLQITFFDPQKVGGTSDLTSLVGFNGAGSVMFSGGNSATNNPYALEPQIVDQTAGKILSVAYQDPTNTPNDWVSIIVERLS